MVASDLSHTEASFAGLRLTATQFFELGETRQRYELINGVTVLAPSPQPRHQLVLDELQFQLGTARRRGVSIRVLPDSDVRFSESEVYCPDVSVYLASRLPTIPKRLEIPPDLVIEILSPSSRSMDLVTKRDDYMRFGVREYWIVDIAGRCVTAWELAADGAIISHEIKQGSLASSAVGGLVLDVDAVMAVCELA